MSCTAKFWCYLGTQNAWRKAGGIAFHTLEVGKVRLLVKASLSKAEGVDDVDNLLGRVIEGLLTFLSRSVGTDICKSKTQMVSTTAPKKEKKTK